MRSLLPTSECWDKSLMCQPLRKCLTKLFVIVVTAVTVIDTSEETGPKENGLPKSRLLVRGGEEM